MYNYRDEVEILANFNLIKNELFLYEFDKTIAKAFVI